MELDEAKKPQSNTEDQKTKVIELDDYRYLEELIERRFESSKFVFSVLDENNGQVFTYLSLSPSLNDIESLYLIESLKDHRRLSNDSW